MWAAQSLFPTPPTYSSSSTLFDPWGVWENREGPHAAIRPTFQKRLEGLLLDPPLSLSPTNCSTFSPALIFFSALLDERPTFPRTKTESTAKFEREILKALLPPADVPLSPVDESEPAHCSRRIHSTDPNMSCSCFEMGICHGEG